MISEFKLAKSTMAESGKGSYRSTLNRFQKFCDARGIKPEAAEQKDVSAYLEQFTQKMLKTRQDYRIVLQSFFSWLQENEVISKNPCKGINITGESRSKKKEELNLDDIKLMVRKCNGLREKTLILFLWYSGMRAKEMLSLRISDVDLEEGYLFVPLSKSKSGNRQIPINDNLLPILTKYIAARKKFNLDHDFLFVNSWKKKVLKYQSLHRLITRLIYPKKFGTHTFRRGFGTSVYNITNDIEMTRALLGHSNIETTRHYILGSKKRVEKFRSLNF